MRELPFWTFTQSGIVTLAGLKWQHRIEHGEIRLNGQPVGVDQPLAVGQQLAYHRPPWKEPDVPLHFNEVYSDNDLLVINKPAGMPVLPGGNFLQNTLLHQLQLTYPENPPVPMHRLGRGNIGVDGAGAIAPGPLDAQSPVSRIYRQGR